MLPPQRGSAAISAKPRGGHSGGKTAAGFWDYRELPRLPPAPFAAAPWAGDARPLPRCRLAARSPLQLLCLSVCQGIVCEGEIRRSQPEVKQHLPSTVPVAGRGSHRPHGPCPGGKPACGFRSRAPGHRPPAPAIRQPGSPLLQKNSVGLNPRPGCEVGGWAEGIPGGGMAQPHY